MKGAGVFVVRAVVANPDERTDFDTWYETEHMPDAIEKFGALRGWRCWSIDNPSVHYAYYMLADVAAVQALPASVGLKALVADFDARWGDRVSRTREIHEVAGMQAAA